MVDDEELEKLREEKREELQQSEDREEDRKKQVKNLASKYLTKEARERLGNIRAARPELASSIEQQIATLGRSGRIEKIDDDQLKQILKEVQGSGEEPDIKFRR